MEGGEKRGRQWRGKRARGWDGKRKVYAEVWWSASVGMSWRWMPQPMFRQLSDSVEHFINPISTGLDRKAKIRPHRQPLPCEGSWSEGWICIQQLPRGAGDCLFSVGSVESCMYPQTLSLKWSVWFSDAQDISLCPHCTPYWLNS